MTRLSKLRLLLNREESKERSAKELPNPYRRVLEEKYKEDCNTMGYWDLASDSKFKYSPTDWVNRQQYLNSTFKKREENTWDVQNAVTNYYFWRGYMFILVLAWFMHY